MFGQDEEAKDEAGGEAGEDSLPEGEIRTAEGDDEDIEAVLVADNEAWRLKEKQFTPEKLAENARADVGSDKWAPKEVNGKTVNQCNIFVADKLHESGAPVPNVGGYAGTLGPEASDWVHSKTDGRIGGQPPSANDWYGGKVPGYEQVDVKNGEVPKPGDVVASAEHVGIVTGDKATVSVTTADPMKPEYGHVVENDWGFRNDQVGRVTFWRYKR